MTIKINVPLKIWDDEKNNYNIKHYVVDWDDKKGTLNGNEKAIDFILWGCERHRGEIGGLMPSTYKIINPLRNKQEMALVLHKIAVPLPDELLLSFMEWGEIQSQFSHHYARQEIVKSGDKQMLADYDKFVASITY